MKIVLTQRIHDDAMAMLANFGETVVATDLLHDIQDADGLIVRLQSVTGEAIRAARRLKVVARHGVGYDNIDIGACIERSIPVCITPDANAMSVAEHVIGSLFAVSRGYVAAHNGQAAGDFSIRNRMPLGIELEGRTIGIVGLGRIGRIVARKAQGLGMRAIGFDPYAADPPCPTVSLDELLATADVITLHTPLTPETHHLVNRERLARMKPGAILINASRGPVVDEGALLEALTSGHLRGAALDVLDPEPPAPDNPLLKLPNILVTPHIAASTEEAMRRMAVTAAEEVIRVLSGQEPRYLIPECRGMAR